MELQSFLEENSATVGKDVLETVYRLAVSQPFQFLYVNLKTLDNNEMFYILLEYQKFLWEFMEHLDRFCVQNQSTFMFQRDAK